MLQLTRQRHSTCIVCICMTRVCIVCVNRHIAEVWQIVILYPLKRHQAMDVCLSVARCGGMHWFDQTLEYKVNRVVILNM